MNRQNIRAGLILGFIGLAVNWFKLELFFNVDFLFGSIVTMFAVMRYGLAAGCIAALVAATATWHHWHQPWAIIIFTAEALFAGLLAKERRRELLTCVILFWFSAGLLLVWFFYHNLMGYSAQVTLLIALKQGVNGIFNTLVAMGLSIVVSSRDSRRRELPSLYQLLFVSMVLFVLIPAMGYLYGDIQKTLHRQLENYRETIAKICDVSEHSISLWLTLNRDTVMTLAGLTGSTERIPQSDMQRIVDKMRSNNPEFRRMGIFDSDAITRVFSPLIDDNGASTIGVDLSDRDFNAILRSPSHPFVFDVDMGKIGTPRPRVMLLAPILDGEHYRGAAFGIVDFAVLQHLLNEIVGAGDMTVTLVDQKGRVVISTRKSLKPLDTYSLPSNGSVTLLADGVGHWIPDDRSGISNAKRWFASLYVKELPLTIGNGWKVVVESSFSRQLEEIGRQTSWSLGIIAFLILAIISLSRLVAGRVSSVLQKLEEVTRQLPVRISSGEQISWPRPATQEFQGLTDNFRVMSDVIQRHVLELECLNETLEQRVADRTQELQQAIYKQRESQVELELQNEELRRIQLALDSSRARYFELYDLAPVGYLTLDEQGLIQEANLTATVMLGVERGSLVRQPLTGYIFPEDQDICYLHRKQLLSTGGPQSCELRMLKICGDRFWAKLEAVSLRDRESGKLVCRVVVSDITARKETEISLRASDERLRLALVASRMGAWEWDLQTNAVIWSPECYEIVGLRDFDGTFESFSALLHPEDAARVMETVAKAIEQKKLYSDEFRIIRPDGALCWLSNLGQVAYDNNGIPVLLIGTVQDVTERKRLHGELHRALTAAKNSNDTMSRLLRTVAHEFRTPLGLLTASTDILDRYWDRMTPDKRYEQNERIRNAARQLAVLVNSVISFNQPDTGKFGNSPRLLDITGLCRTIAADVAVVWSTGQEWHVDIAEDCGTAVVDEFLLRRILENLLTNAFRYTPSDGAVSLRIKRELNRLCLEIADTGIGIPEEDQNLIFEAFYRSCNVEGRRGLGLGLSIVQEALVQMDGTITVSSRTGHGTVMRVEIPVGHPAGT